MNKIGSFVATWCFLMVAAVSFYIKSILEDL